MIQVPIVDRAFQGGISMQGAMPRRMRWLWDWTGPQKWVVFTDRAIDCLDHGYTKADGAVKVALLIEAKHCDHVGYLTLKRHIENVTYVLTHELSVVQEWPDKALWYPHGGCWISSEDIRLDHIKTHRVSIIASDKASTIGHRLRHAIVKQFGIGNQLSAFGKGYSPIQEKAEGLAPFRFSLAIENGCAEDYFTEKLIDCFATGTVPIYWGTGGIVRHFNMDGVIMLPFGQDDALDSLEAIMPTLTPDRYEAMRPAIEDNFHRCKEFFNSEDWICEHYPFLFV